MSFMRQSREKYTGDPDLGRLSNAVEEHSELMRISTYPLPLRHQIVRIMSILTSSIVLLAIGGAMHSHSKSIVEQVVPYEFTCAGTQIDDATRQCDKLIITIKEKITQPVYVYYHLTKFWQNHFLYVRSLSDSQVFGSDMSDTDNCGGTQFGGQLDNTDAGKIIVPCGLQAWSRFDDEITVDVIAKDGQTKCTDCLDYNDIALELDLDRFVAFNSSLSENSAYTSTVDAKIWNDELIRGETTIPDLRDESFMVWMRYAPTPDFKKLHSIIKQDLEPEDTLEISIINKFNNDVYNGKKELIFTQARAFGGKHDFLSTIFILAGVLPIVIVLITIGTHFYIATKNRSQWW